MKDVRLRILTNDALTPEVWRMTLQGYLSAITAPGQFVNLALEGLYLRRPISVCDLEGDVLTLIYKVVGKGTARMSALTPGATVDTLIGLGNGYDLSLAGSAPLLLGGGVGVPPLYLLAKRLRERGARVQVVLGFGTASEVFLEEAFRALGCEMIVTTLDGTRGVRGVVTDALPADYSAFYTCGPEPMLRAVHRLCRGPGQFSFEERMGCGFGACMGCSCRTITGNKRICREGPVLSKEEILWED